MNKKGFVSMAVIYTFIIAFLLVMLSMLSAYAFRNRIINSQIDEVKTLLNGGYE